MSIRNSALLLSLVFVLFAATPNGFADVRVSHAEPVSPLEPGYFDYDVQLFAPADITEFGGHDAPIGWYATYSRLYWFVSNADSAGDQFGEWTWGNQFTGGYMTEEDHGWHAEFIHISGPNDRAAVTNAFGTQTGTQFVARADLQSFELSKTFRLEPLHDGSILEPFIGGRFTSFRDETTNPVIPGFGFFGQPQKRRVLNSMWGGQLGVRWFKQKGRWTVSGLAKVMPMQNFQYFAVPPASQDEFVIAGDLRGQLSYHLTRDLTLAFGGEFLHFGRGIARGNSVLTNDQDVTMGGFSMSLEWNR